MIVAFVPRRRSVPRIAALSAAILIAVQLTAEHWFYLYIPWFFGLLITALGAEGESKGETSARGGAATHGIRRPLGSIE